MAGGGESLPAHSEKAIAATIHKIKGIGRDRRSWEGSPRRKWRRGAYGDGEIREEADDGALR
jgi:hypothetical protein